jgi:hypothetical protein
LSDCNASSGCGFGLRRCRIWESARQKSIGKFVFRKYGLRVLVAAPGFTGIALLVIALGIGSTVSIFSVVNAVLLRSLPYAHLNELVYLWSPNPNFKGVPQEMGPMFRISINGGASATASQRWQCSGRP